MNTFIDHIGDGYKHYRMAITFVLHNECLGGDALQRNAMLHKSSFIIILDGLPGFARIPKRQTNQEFKKKLTRLGYEPPTSALQADSLTT